MTTPEPPENLKTKFTLSTSVSGWLAPRATELLAGLSFPAKDYELLSSFGPVVIDEVVTVTDVTIVEGPDFDEGTNSVKAVAGIEFTAKVDGDRPWMEPARPFEAWVTLRIDVFEGDVAKCPRFKVLHHSVSEFE